MTTPKASDGPCVDETRGLIDQAMSLIAGPATYEDAPDEPFHGEAGFWSLVLHRTRVMMLRRRISESILSEIAAMISPTRRPPSRAGFRPSHPRGYPCGVRTAPLDRCGSPHRIIG